MARGFESKDVEYQQSEAERTRSGSSAAAPGLSDAAREAASTRRTLVLALARARADMASARSEAHRQMLTAAIAALEQRIAQIDTK